MKYLSLGVLVTGLVTATACGGSSDGPTADEAAAIDAGGSATNETQELVVVADAIVGFDPTIVPSATAETNAQSIGAHAMSTLGSCGQVTVSGASVTVDFGAAPGCTIRNGLQASGSTTLAVSSAGGTTTLAFTFASLIVGGSAIDGTASFATTDGSGFALTAALTTASGSITDALTVTGSSGALTMDGTVGSTHGGSTNALQFASVVYHQGDCYPSAGTLGVTRGAVNVSIAFDAATASTGNVTVTEGRRSYPSQLPAYGSCPGS